MISITFRESARVSEITCRSKTLTGVDGISFLTDGQHLNPRLVSDKNYVLIVLVPGLNEMKYDTLWTMENYMKADLKHLDSLDLDSDEDYDEDGDTTEDEEEKDGISFQTVELKKKLLQSKMKELSEHIGRNEGVEDQVQFFVTHDRDKGFKCCNLLYDFTNEEKPMKTFWYKFPTPPTNVRSRVEVNGRTRRSKLSSLSIRVEWDNNQDKRCHFLVEHRPQGSSQWTRNVTKKGQSNCTISVDPGTKTEIRVAAENIIGVGEFSEIIVSDAVLTTESLQPPTALRTGWVNQTTADIEWTPENPTFPQHRFSFRARYWQSGHASSSANELNVKSSESCCRLEELEENSTYFVKIFIVSGDSSKISSFSELLTFTTVARGVRVASLMVDRCEKIENRQGMDIFAVPLSKTYPY